MIKKFEQYNEIDPYDEENWNEVESTKLRYITIHAFDKNSSANYSENILFDDNRERMKQSIDDFFASVPFTKYYYEAECQDILTHEEIEYLEEFGIDVY